MEVLYDRLSRQAFGLAYRMLGDGAAAEDVVQESFLSVWRQSERIDTARGKLQSLVLTVVHNKAIDHLRSRKSGSQDLPLEPAVSGAVEGDFTDRVAAAVDGEVVREALDSLPDDQRQAVELAYYKGLTHTEISERLGLPLGTVKGRLRLALDKMRMVLGAERAT
jgi:RNA polymerase sigma-70 factor (ECF subfamily)